MDLWSHGGGSWAQVTETIKADGGPAPLVGFISWLVVWEVNSV